MQSFTFHSPTEIVFGKGVQSQTRALVLKYGGSRVLIVYGGGSVVRSGLLAEIEQQFTEGNVACKLYGGVKPNPIVSHARQGIKEALEFGADFILAVGGGSVIDEAKAIAHGVKNPETDIWSFWSGEAELKASLPVGTVLTISAAGSETSASAVLTNDGTGQKRGLTSQHNRPVFAVMNPELTYTLPKFQIACGAADIMMHTLERYFLPVSGNRITDEIAEGLLRTVIRFGRKAVSNPFDYEAMSELMWCGSLSHSNLTGLGRPMDFSVHQFGHELGGRFDVSHGAALTTIWGHWAEYCYMTDVSRFAHYARSVWKVHNPDERTAAAIGIERTVDYFREIGMPVSFSELGIGVRGEEEILAMADRVSWGGTRKIGQLKPLDTDGIAEIFRMANR
jgi:hypothetical protein